MNSKQICAGIIAGDFKPEDFNSIIQAVTFARSQLGKEVKRSLKIGATVKYHSARKGVDMTGTVTKIAIKFVTVNCGAHGMWRVPANLLEVV